MKSTFYRSIFLIISINLFFPGQSQLPINDLTNRIEYEEIMSFDLIAKESLYNKVWEWNLINDVSIILYDSTENNKLICEKIFNYKCVDKGLLTTVGSKEYGIQYNLFFDFKDGRMRCRITNINFLEYKDPGITGINWGYGITTTKLKSGEIIRQNVEDYYPLEKNDRRYRELYDCFFQGIDIEINETLSRLRNYINISDENW